MNKSISSVDDLSRFEIIVENFIFLLELNKVTKKKFAIDNHMSPSTITRIIKGETELKIDFFNMICNYFNISANSLYYSTKEKNEMENEKNSADDQIFAKKHIKLSFFAGVTASPLKNVILPILSILVPLLLIFLQFDYDFILYSSLIIYILFIILSVNLNKVYKEVYSINYLDEIIYKIEKNKNMIQFVKHIIALLSLVIQFVIISCFFEMVDLDECNIPFIFTIFISLFITFVIIILTIGCLKTNYEYQSDNISLVEFKISRLNFHFNFCTFITLICFQYYTRFSINLFILSFLLNVCSIVIFNIISFTYSKYKLYYHAYNKKERLLFPDK